MLRTSSIKEPAPWVRSAMVGQKVLLCRYITPVPRLASSGWWPFDPTKLSNTIYTVMQDTKKFSPTKRHDNET